MDNSNSSDYSLPKMEPEPENDGDISFRDTLSLTSNESQNFTCWHQDNTMKLIKTMEKDCKELWDPKHPLNKDRAARLAKQEYLAEMFGTTYLEINRKIHNLRTQYNNEIRKLKKRQKSGEGCAGGRWEYFDALSFLQRTPALDTDPLEIDAVNMSVLFQLAEFQAEEEEEFGAAARAHASMMAANTTAAANNQKPKGRPARVAASGPPMRQVSGVLMMSPEEAVPSLRPGMKPDECQIFGDFVASELRMLRSEQTRKTLKRLIQKAILEIGEDEDMNSFNS